MLPCKFSYITLFPSNAAAPDSLCTRQMLKYADPFVMSLPLLLSRSQWTPSCVTHPWHGDEEFLIDSSCPVSVMAADPAIAVLPSTLIHHCTSKKPVHLPFRCCGWSHVLYDFTVLLVKHFLLHSCRKQPLYQGTCSGQFFFLCSEFYGRGRFCFVQSRKLFALTLKCLYKGCHRPQSWTNWPN